MVRLFVFLTVLFSLNARLAAAPATNHHVIIVTIDGFAAYLFDDPKSPIPNLRKLAAEGVVGEGLKVSNPSVTWPNHTTLVTGVHPQKHSVLYNGIMVPDKRGELQRVPEADMNQLVKAPTVFEFLHPKGFKTAGVNWPCTRNSPAVDFNFPDVPNMVTHMTPRLFEELVAANILEAGSKTNFADNSPTRKDEIWTQTVSHLLRKHQPNFLLFHLLLVDGTHHRFGPRSPEGYEALGKADERIGEMMATLESTGLKTNTSIFIVSDHGFERVDKQIAGTVLLRKAGLLHTEGEPSRARVQAISEGGTLMVYLHDEKTRDADRAKVLELFRAQEGVDEILEPKDFAEHGYPMPRTHPWMADLVVSAKPGYGFSNLGIGNETLIPTRQGGIGSHGFLAKNPKMNAVFIASGRGIQKGKRIGVVDNRDIAPTAAHLLGEQFPGSDGKVLREILNDR